MIEGDRDFCYIWFREKEISYAREFPIIFFLSSYYTVEMEMNDIQNINLKMTFSNKDTSSCWIKL